MKNYICILLFCRLGISQTVLHVFRFQFDKATAFFEEKVLSDIIDMVNVKEKKSYIIKYHEQKSFKALFDKIDENKFNGNSLSISSITVTDERKVKYDFSPIYLPIRYAILVHKRNKLLNWKSEKNTLGYIPETTDEQFVKQYQKLYNFKIKRFTNSTDRINALKNGDIDFILSEIISTFNDQNFIEIDNFLLEENGYGMMFAKKSKLAFLLKPYIKYYSRSKKYYRLLKKSFGNDIAQILHHEISRKK